MVKKVFITRNIDEEVIQTLATHFQVEVWHSEHHACPREELMKQAADSHALLTMLSDQVDQELLDHAPQLEIVANLAVGYDNIDVKAAAEKGITITNTPDVLTDTTADLAFSLLMASARRIVEAADYVKQGSWQSWSPYLLAGSDIHHKTIGIIGMGKIGEAVAKRARGFDMTILYHNRSRNHEAEQNLQALYRTLDELLQESDFVVCLAPLTEETKGMIGAEQFALMKETAYFINAGRGPVADEKALIHALQEKELAGAGLDVFEKEPIDSSHPLLSMKNVIAVPHIGSSSFETRKIMMELCADNITHVLTGNDPLTKVH
ncbi:D-glycerate dehydrogenase [Jeotgalibacillus sp. ET6]|uniref:2-hydroxyacid dehydrogenase n=1 Tax=Jeotgalibacillus sp. ET6 TaxID=3037260 RepID=UPI0024183380|nr:D-glycerate dehydrogenase [Jeotgalibacillus sp. ET6]MDG5471770.1 D-glycerate dehydrogenase [Jeotgalibacillus sp. ET6]